MPDDEQNPDLGKPVTLPPDGAAPTAGDGGKEGAAAAREPRPDQEDRFRPEAIAARVDQIGEETDLDRVAREEEKKLLE
ncbi:MAG TPA: hypothetical protein VN894_17315, partial [Polyangiaceae bacterium]|nr:hypothetical protein [Polyangiaceae bacterium]